eukprot:NODE_5950_length_947_cov_28.629854_g5363_i0.p1 GENE.NODE_5950_length_947_cov_28.629854_g5363_i0~~NODE_5950_length_947_cov_28.629854_g5363_i0.p1  ORF type:complete len:289 (+),score=5.30 NODE_5950_length_947_cov_28.629854_g5363_i0:58-924(+)
MKWKQHAHIMGLKFMSLLGYLCIIIAWLLISITLYFYFHDIIPKLLDLRSFKGCVSFLPATWISFNLLFNYYMVIKTHPGKPSESFHLTDDELKWYQSQPLTKGERWSRYCNYCRSKKPPRTHHCHMCGQCILKMDHHCPWINQCVGHHNHRYFFLFLIYMLCACTYGVLTIIVYHFTTTDVSEYPFSILFTFVMCITLIIIMALFLSWNIYLLRSNQTTIEVHHNWYEKREYKKRGEIYVGPYDFGAKRNIKQVFGPFRYYWQILLPSTDPLPNNGETWTNEDENTV